jgi:AhpD family alkylhydroperoxidase
MSTSEALLKCRGSEPIIGRRSAARRAVPLVRLVEPQDADPAVLPTLESGMASYGMALNTWRALLHRPEIFAAYLPYLRAVVGAGTIAPRTKDLAALTVAIANHCRYSASHRAQSGAANGISADDMAALAEGRLDAFSAEERLAIRFASDLTLAPPATPHDVNPQAVDRDLLAALRKTFDEPQLVELAANVALWNALTRFHRVMDLPLDMPAPPPAIDAVL